MKCVQFSKRFKEPYPREHLRTTLLDNTIPFGVRLVHLLCYTLGLRVHEAISRYITFPDGTRRLSVPIWRSGVSHHPDGSIQLVVRLSKSDVNNLGKAMPVLPVPADPLFCPVTWINRFLSAHPVQHPTPATDCPLFVHPDGQPILYDEVLAALRKHAAASGMDPLSLGTHSNRIKATQTAVEAGLHGDILDPYFRWSVATGAAMRHRYARLSKSRVQQVSDALSLTNTAPDAVIYPASR